MHETTHDMRRGGGVGVFVENFSSESLVLDDNEESIAENNNSQDPRARLVDPESQTTNTEPAIDHLSQQPLHSHSHTKSQPNPFVNLDLYSQQQQQSPGLHPHLRSHSHSQVHPCFDSEMAMHLGVQTKAPAPPLPSTTAQSSRTLRVPRKPVSEDTGSQTHTPRGPSPSGPKQDASRKVGKSTSAALQGPPLQAPIQAPIQTPIQTPMQAPIQAPPLVQGPVRPQLAANKTPDLKQFLSDSAIHGESLRRGMSPLLTVTPGTSPDKQDGSDYVDPTYKSRGKLGDAPALPVFAEKTHVALTSVPPKPEPLAPPKSTSLSPAPVLEPSPVFVEGASLRAPRPRSAIVVPRKPVGSGGGPPPIPARSPERNKPAALRHLGTESPAPRDLDTLPLPVFQAARPQRYSSPPVLQPRSNKRPASYIFNNRDDGQDESIDVNEEINMNRDIDTMSPSNRPFFVEGSIDGDDGEYLDEDEQDEDEEFFDAEPGAESGGGSAGSALFSSLAPSYRSSSFQKHNTSYWKYHILKYSKDLYLTTTPDPQHMAQRVGPSVYVNVTRGEHGSREFELQFEEGGSKVASVERIQGLVKGQDRFVICIFDQEALQGTGLRKMIYTAYNCSRVLDLPISRSRGGARQSDVPESHDNEHHQHHEHHHHLHQHQDHQHQHHRQHTRAPSNLTHKKKTLERYSITDRLGREWMIGAHYDAERMEISESRVTFTTAVSGTSADSTETANPGSEPSRVTLGQFRRRLPRKKKILKLGRSRESDVEVNDDGDPDKMGWVYMYEEAIVGQPAWMRYVVMGLLVGVGYSQRVDRQNKRWHHQG